MLHLQHKNNYYFESTAADGNFSHLLWSITCDQWGDQWGDHLERVDYL